MKKYKNVHEYMASIPNVVAAADRLIAKVETSRLKVLAEKQSLEETSDESIKKIEYDQKNTC